MLLKEKAHYLPTWISVTLFVSVVAISFLVTFTVTAVLDQSRAEQDDIVQGELLDGWRIRTESTILAVMGAARALEGYVTSAYTLPLPNISANYSARTFQTFTRFEQFSSRLNATAPGLNALFLLPGGATGQVFPPDAQRQFRFGTNDFFEALQNSLNGSKGSSLMNQSSLLEPSFRSSDILAHSPVFWLGEWCLVLRVPIHNGTDAAAFRKEHWWGEVAALVSAADLLSYLGMANHTRRNKWNFAAYTYTPNGSLALLMSSAFRRASNPQLLALIERQHTNHATTVTVTVTPGQYWYITIWKSEDKVLTTATIAITVVVVVLGTVLLVLFANVVYARVTQVYTGFDVAPKRAPFALCTIGIYRGETMWSRYPEAMREHCELFKEDVMDAIEHYGGYHSQQLLQHVHCLTFRSVDACVHFATEVMERNAKRNTARRAAQHQEKLSSLRSENPVSSDAALFQPVWSTAGAAVEHLPQRPAPRLLLPSDGSSSGGVVVVGPFNDNALPPPSATSQTQQQQQPTHGRRLSVPPQSPTLPTATGLTVTVGRSRRHHPPGPPPPASPLSTPVTHSSEERTGSDRLYGMARGGGLQLLCMIHWCDQAEVHYDYTVDHLEYEGPDVTAATHFYARVAECYPSRIVLSCKAEQHLSPVLREPRYPVQPLMNGEFYLISDTTSSVLQQALEGAVSLPLLVPPSHTGGNPLSLRQPPTSTVGGESLGPPATQQRTRNNASSAMFAVPRSTNSSGDADSSRHNPLSSDDAPVLHVAGGGGGGPSSGSGSSSLLARSSCAAEWSDTAGAACPPSWLAPQVPEVLLHQFRSIYTPLAAFHDDIPFEDLKTVMYHYLRAFQILFQPFAPAERGNIQRRLVTAFGVPSQKLLEHLAVRCALRFVTESQQQQMDLREAMSACSTPRTGSATPSISSGDSSRPTPG